MRRRRDRDPVLGRFARARAARPRRARRACRSWRSRRRRSATARRRRRRSTAGAPRRGRSARSRALTSGHAIRSRARRASEPAPGRLRAWVDSATTVPIDQPQAQAEQAQSLYRRHRPRTFADVVGQEPVVRTLRNAVRAREGPPRLPVRRLARDRQDLDGEDPRGLPELRARPDDRALRASANRASRSRTPTRST